MPQIPFGISGSASSIRESSQKFVVFLHYSRQIVKLPFGHRINLCQLKTAWRRGQNQFIASAYLQLL